MSNLLKMALLDLGRNRRRTLLSALAVSMGLALLLLMAGVLNGEMQGAMTNTILLQSGDLQIRGASYNIDKMSLDWKDLVASPASIVEQVQGMPQVSSAAARLFASGIITLGENSRGVEVIGLDPDAGPNQVFRKGLLSGSFITTDDRDGIMIGQPLADKLHIKQGDQVSLLVNTSGGSTDEQTFTVRGVYTTNTTAYDENTVFMPLAKAQAITGAQDHASTIFVLLKDREQADSVAAALQSPGFQVLTWRKMNELIVQTEDFANAFMMIFYLIVLGITATVVTNTLVMAVFERTREIGILTAIGMKARRVLAQFLTEAGFIATAGVIGGMILGLIVVGIFNHYGFYVGNYGMTGMLLSDRIYANLRTGDAVNLAIITYVVTLLASLYPAIMASRMEPVEALHAQ